MGIEGVQMRKTIGLIVNPVAGMGGSVGLKGTDDGMYKRALELRAEPVTPKRANDLLMHIEGKDAIKLLVAPGTMGERYIAGFDVPITVVGEIGAETSAEDTKRIAQEMVAGGADLLVFVGGDGTARDIYDAVGTRVPVVGVPAGVKVFSSVFAFSARAAAEMVDAFVAGSDVTEEEVLDIDEEAFRQDRLASRLYGYLLVPEVRVFLQPGKLASSVTESAAESKRDIAAFIVEEMDPEVLYLLGPGTTLRAITDALGLPKTLLGVDAVHAGALVGQDVNERDILSLFEQYELRKIIVTPIGGNGFIFGRGSKQFTPAVIRQVRADEKHPKENIIVAGTRHKLSGLDCLRVDTGDLKLDEELSGYIRVTVGYREGMMVKVEC
jgi:predicted polyphosphate/ATP-dependent NAD kinase